MHVIRKYFFYSLFIAFGLVLTGTVTGYLILQNSLPAIGGEARLKQLSAPVSVGFSRHGIPVIDAENRLDAIRALGFVTARDRLFQMELMRRQNAGSLAEIFGRIAFDSDVKIRTYGFNRVAKAVWAKLPKAHRRYLEAYADGVNGYIGQANALPFEFTVLGFRPLPWKAEDCILIALGMLDLLTAVAEDEERMLTIMEKTLPEDIVAFLTPDTDRFTDQLLNHAESRRPVRPIPAAALSTALASAYRQPSDQMQLAEAVQLSDSTPGSNAWLIGSKKTHDGRVILANDMHLGLSVPNIWYRAQLHYGNVHAAGLTLPGTPIMIAGTNNHIAWGGTNLSGDFLDLVSLDINPENPDEYRVDDRWRRFEQFTEKIAVKNAGIQEIMVRQSLWGPVATAPLLGKPVAIHWTALDADAFNIGLIELERTETLQQALAIVNETGGPQLNFLAADNNGHIAWTLMGKIPDRFGIDGSVSRSWADGKAGWNGYVDARKLPRTIDPPEGLLVSANDRRLGKEYPYVIGRQFANGYRAYRITRQLGQIRNIDESSMFELQLDVESEFYAYYRQLALSVLSPGSIEREPQLAGIRDYVSAWNGRADAGSLGFALLVEFRRQLATAVFKPFLAACRQADQKFTYSWTYIDTPLQAMLTEKVPSLLPDPVNYRDWDAFILGQLKHSAERLKAAYPDIELAKLTWGRVNKAQLAHPFSRSIPFAGAFLDMPAAALAGCYECVRVASPRFGASERLVVSPGHPQEGILHMPGGQSGHPVSPNYRDQQDFWVNGLPMPLLAGKPEHRLSLKP